MSTEGNWRESWAPFSEEELLKAKNVIAPSMPSFKDGSFASTDISLFLDEMKWPRTPEIKKVYQDFWDRYFNGKVDVEYLIILMSKCTETKQWLPVCLKIVDLDKNGFISSNEFEILVDLLRTHDTNWPGKTFADFVAEADLNADGKVSIEECSLWVKKYLPNL